MNNEQFAYQPGICNIDSAGVLWRKRLGYVALVAGIISMAALYYLHFGIIFRCIIGAGFGYASSLNLLQAKEHFCVMNAAKLTYETSLHKTKITDDTYKDLDRKKMRSMIGRALLYALAGGCLGLLPL